MRSLLVPALTLGLASCQTLTNPTVVNTLREVCTYEPIAWLAFAAFAPRASPRVALRVNQAHAIVTSICANPPTNVAGAFATAYASYLIISGATR